MVCRLIIVKSWFALIEVNCLDRWARSVGEAGGRGRWARPVGEASGKEWWRLSRPPGFLGREAVLVGRLSGPGGCLDRETVWVKGFWSGRLSGPGGCLGMETVWAGWLVGPRGWQAWPRGWPVDKTGLSKGKGSLIGLCGQSI